jgi:hypothetical protein
VTGARPPIRVWLEPAYDFGRFGAWMLDLPGCFVWRDDRSATLAAVPARVEQFGGWLASHGEPVARSGGAVEVVEEVAAVPRADLDTELNATFAADRQPVGGDALDRAIRWLEFARADLLAEVEDMPPGPATSGVAERSPNRNLERPAVAVVRHLAFAEIWMAGRMDPTSRYAGPGLEAELTDYLEATHAWAVERIRGLAAASPSDEVIDRRGESWTLPKVLRRLIYHSIDHLDEIRQGRALARA